MAKYYGDGAVKELCRMINKIDSHSAWEVFSDFVAMAAISVSNAVDKDQAEGREKQYMELIGKYRKQEQVLFGEMLMILVDGLESEIQGSGPKDLLGMVYHGLELHNKWKGQFFTPSNVSEMMALMSLGEYEPIMERNGYITMGEPCCGAGGMVLAFAKAMKQRGYNYCAQVLVIAMDIDIKCVHMCYLQLALCGIPAVVIHGNTLTVEEWSHWYTPAYIWGGWRWKEWLRREKLREQETAIESQPEVASVAKSCEVTTGQEKVASKSEKRQRKKKKSPYEQMSMFDMVIERKGEENG